MDLYVLQEMELKLVKRVDVKWEKKLVKRVDEEGKRGYILESFFLI